MLEMRKGWSLCSANEIKINQHNGLLIFSALCPSMWPPPAPDESNSRGFHWKWADGDLGHVLREMSFVPRTRWNNLLWQWFQTVISDESLQEDNWCFQKMLIMNRSFREFMAGRENMLSSGGSLYQWNYDSKHSSLILLALPTVKYVKNLK